MSDDTIAIGKILKEEETSYRIISASVEKVVLCEMGITKLNILALPYMTIREMLRNGQAVLLNDEMSVFDKDKLSEKVRENYEKKQKIMREVEAAYGPTFLGLMGKGPKPKLTTILEEYSMDTCTFWRTLRKYLQSGMQTISLVDPKAFGLNKGKVYGYDIRTGRKPKHNINEYIITDTDRKHFAEALKWYSSGRCKTKRAAYIDMSDTYYVHEVPLGGNTDVKPLPESERPTLNQFYHYCRTHLTKKENDRIKTSAMEQRNDKRLLNSDSFDDVYGPGDMVQIDAREMDCSLVAPWDRNLSVGNPTVYVAVDVRSRIILAVSVAFDQNSVIGITNLLLNLAEDKQEYCARFNVKASRETISRLWPSNIFPRRIRVDRGSEFTSDEFERICNELHIEREIVPPGSGSLKGVVERLLGQLEEPLKPYLEGNGLRTKRHDSKHNREAILSVNDFTSLVIDEVLAYNQRYNSNYPKDSEREEKHILSEPVILWDYYIEKYGAPRFITNIDQYKWSLMTKIDARVSRGEGISFKGLYYLSDDPELDEDRYNAGRRKVPFEVRMDVRSVDEVYYIRNDQLIKAPLNEARDNMSSFKGMALDEYKLHWETGKKMDAEGELHNQRLEADQAQLIKATIKSAQKPTYSSDKNIRPARHAEKQRVTAEGAIKNRLPGPEEAGQQAIPAAAQEPEDAKQDAYETEFEEYTNFEEALQDYKNNN